MAEILVLARKTPKLPKGAVISARPDRWPWGRRERPPNFVVIHVHDADVRDMRTFEDAVIDSTGDLETMRYHRLDARQVDYALGKGRVSEKLSRTKIIDDSVGRLWLPSQ